MGDVIGCNAALFDIFKDELEPIAADPTPEERREELDERARDVLENRRAQTPEPALKVGGT